jgi:hypothetical protein
MKNQFVLLLLLLGFQFELSAQFVDLKECVSFSITWVNARFVSVKGYQNAIIRRAGSQLDFITITYNGNGYPIQVDMPKNELSPVGLSYRYEYAIEDDQFPSRITVWMDGELSTDYRVTLDDERFPVEINVVLNKFSNYTKERYYILRNNAKTLGCYSYKAFDESGQMVYSISDKMIRKGEDFQGYERYINKELYTTYKISTEEYESMSLKKIEVSAVVDGQTSIELLATFDENGPMTHFYKPNPSDGVLVEYTISYE